MLQRKDGTFRFSKIDAMLTLKKQVIVISVPNYMIAEEQFRSFLRHFSKNGMSFRPNEFKIKYPNGSQLFWNMPADEKIRGYQGIEIPFRNIIRDELSEVENNG